MPFGLPLTVSGVAGFDSKVCCTSGLAAAAATVTPVCIDTGLQYKILSRTAAELTNFSTSARPAAAAAAQQTQLKPGVICLLSSNNTAAIVFESCFQTIICYSSTMSAPEPGDTLVGAALKVLRVGELCNCCWRCQRL